MRFYPVLSKLWRRAFARPAFARMNRLLFGLSLAGLGIGNHEDDDSSGERAMLRRLARSWKGLSPVVLDVGAHDGHYARLVLEQCPGAFVHAFEPHPATFSRLKAATAALNVMAHSFGLDRKAGRVSFFDYAGSSGSEHASQHREIFTQIHNRPLREIKVQVRTLDQVASQLRFKRIHLLKVDTEGHELAVLEGGKRLLNSGRVDCLQIEFNAMNLASRSLFRDFEALLPDYDWYRLLPNAFQPMAGYGPELKEIFVYQNLFAIRKGLALP